MGASIALVMSQIMPTSSSATGASLSIVGLLYIIRAGTDVSNIDLSNINPDRKSTRLNSSHVSISYAVFCLKKKIKIYNDNDCVFKQNDKFLLVLMRGSLA